MAVPFVGRSAELAMLVALVRRGHDAHAPAVAIVSVEPGNGKTRLLAETIALLPVVRTIRLAGFEPMEPIALGAAGELLRGLSTVPVEGPILAALVHDGSTDLHSEPLRVFEAAHRALTRLGPLRLTIDDLQWVDRPSLALIDYLVRAAESRHLRLTVLATGRPSAALTTFASRIENELPLDRRATLEIDWRSTRKSPPGSRGRSARELRQRSSRSWTRPRRIPCSLAVPAVRSNSLSHRPPCSPGSVMSTRPSSS